LFSFYDKRALPAAVAWHKLQRPKILHVEQSGPQSQSPSRSQSNVRVVTVGEGQSKLEQSSFSPFFDACYTSKWYK